MGYYLNAVWKRNVTLRDFTSWTYREEMGKEKTVVVHYLAANVKAILAVCGK